MLLKREELPAQHTWLVPDSMAYSAVLGLAVVKLLCRRGTFVLVARRVKIQSSAQVDLCLYRE